MAFSPDGKTLAAAGHDGSVRVWDAKTGEVLHTLTGHGDTAHAVCFAPDGATLATAGEDGRVRLWDAATGKHQRDLDGHRGRVWGLSFAPDGRELASAGGDQTVRVWNPTTGAERAGSAGCGAERTRSSTTRAGSSSRLRPTTPFSCSTPARGTNWTASEPLALP